MSFYVYILRCADASYYVGHTDSLETRVSAHEKGEIPGFTRTRRPIRLVFADEFAARDEAIQRERQIKGWSRAKKEALIASNWERLRRLTLASSGKRDAPSRRAHPSAVAPTGASVQDSLRPGAPSTSSGRTGESNAAQAGGQELPRPYPRPDRETAPYWEAQRAHKLKFQRCSDCGEFRFPVSPMCPACRSFNFEWTASSGRGAIYSYTVVHHQTHPAFSVPYTIVLVELEDGPRVVAQLRQSDGKPVSIGIPVALEWEDHPEQPLPVFVLEK
jgi:predicted GIY-YIG superfamily endonuclease/uncharacterized OB-fold protein